MKQRARLYAYTRPATDCILRLRSACGFGKANVLTRERIRKELLHLRVLCLGFFQNGMSRSVSWAGVLPPNGCKQITLEIRFRTPPHSQSTHLAHIIREKWS